MSLQQYQKPQQRPTWWFDSKKRPVTEKNSRSTDTLEREYMQAVRLAYREFICMVEEEQKEYERCNDYAFIQARLIVAHNHHEVTEKKLIQDKAEEELQEYLESDDYKAASKANTVL